MKRLTILLLLSSSSFLFVAPAASAADARDPCLKKRANILKQIDQARQRGNDKRVAGLTTALREQEANCSPDSIREAREQDVVEARLKVAERERELQEAKSDGKEADKLARRQAKLDEAKDDLAQAQKALGH